MVGSGCPKHRIFLGPYQLLIWHVKEVSQLNIMLLDSINSVSLVLLRPYIGQM